MRFAIGLRLVALVAASLFFACDEDEADPPDRPCTVVERKPGPPSEQLALARTIADRWIASHPPEQLQWDWTDGVLAESFVALHRATGDARYRDYLRAYVDAYLPDGYAVLTSDRCPPALASLELYQTSCEAKYVEPVDKVLLFVYERALRTPEGAINHLGVSEILGRSVWVDSLFMFGTVLVRWGESENDVRALGEYGAQYAIFARLLQDPSGFFVHAHGWPGPQDPNVFWARGNGWVIASGFDYLRVRKQRGEADAVVRESLVKLTGAIASTQDPATGLWWSIANRPGEIYLETSGSALFALGLARGYRHGALDASVLPVIQKAMQGVRSKIVDGVVTDVSGPTTVSTFRGYSEVPLLNDLPYGTGAVILALLETAGLP